jgi:hypothetical protein
MNADPGRRADPVPYATPARVARAVPVWVWCIVGGVGAAFVLAVMLFTVKVLPSRTGVPATVSPPTTSAATSTGSP